MRNVPPVSNRRTEVLVLLLVLGLVFAAWGGGWYLIDRFVTGSDEVKEGSAQLRGLFGDKFGAINALFSGLAFAGIIFSIVLQNRELNQTNRALEEQSRTINSQRFDSTFFQLLQLHNEITAKLRDLQHEGRDAFKSFYERLLSADDDFAAFCGLRKLKREQIRRIIDSRIVPADLKMFLEESDVANIETRLASGTSCCENFLDDSMDMHEEKFKKAYTQAAVQHIDNYSHYFRNLYHILKFIKESDLIASADKARYAKIVRSQLAEVELLALLYNSLTEIRLPGRETMELGFPKMGTLLKEFDILQNLSDRSVIHPIHRKIFDKNYSQGVRG